jgi:hypothetical protein
MKIAGSGAGSISQRIWIRTKMSLIRNIAIRIVLASWIRMLIRNDETSWIRNEAMAIIPNTANKDIQIRIRRNQITASGLAFI